MPEDSPIYDKYDVTRVDGGSEPGGDHEECMHFVFDLTHDPEARAALRYYAYQIRRVRPRLARSIQEQLDDLERS